MIGLIDAASASAEPLMPPKKIAVTTETCASPPGTQPTTRSASVVSLPVSSQRFSNSPARTNVGSASSDTESIEPNMSFGSIMGGIRLPENSMKQAEERTRFRAIGTFSMSKTKKGNAR
jgi:hypothetical protein